MPHAISFAQQTAQNHTRVSVTLAGLFEHYLLEASDDLVYWVALTNVVSSNGIMVVIDADAGQYSKWFYRAVLALPPPNIGSPQRPPDGAFHSISTANSRVATKSWLQQISSSGWLTEIIFAVIGQGQNE